MSYTSGIASGYLDLLSRIDSFLTSTGHCYGLEYSGSGNGTLTGVPDPDPNVQNNYLGTSSSVEEEITATATSSTSFTVTGSASGNLGTATVGSNYNGAKCSFKIIAGTTPFQAGDTFTFNTSRKWQRIRLAGCADSTNRTASFGECQKLFDLNTSTGYANISITPGSPATWVRIDCGAFPATVKSFSVGAGATTKQPTAFALQWSDNGSSWTEAAAYTGQSFTTSEIKTYPVTGTTAKRFWRVVFTASNGTGTNLNKIDLNEVRFWGGESGANSWPIDSRLEYGWKAPGLDNLQDIFIPGFTYTVPTDDLYNLCFRGFRFETGIEPDPTYRGGITPSTGTVAMCLRDVSMAYWFVVHGARAIIIVRHTALYQYAYLGFGLPYEPPAAMPYPVVISAPSNIESRRFDSLAGSYRNPADPGSDTMWVMMPDGTFNSIDNRQDSSGNPEGANGGYNVTYPYSEDNNGTQLDDIRDNIDGTLPFLPIAIRTDVPYAHMWGELDGVYWTTGFNNTTERISRIGQIDYISIPNVMRTAINSWSAIALD